MGFDNEAKLRAENDELKSAIAILLNKPLVKKLQEALDRINNGEYVTEEEFFKGRKS